MQTAFDRLRGQAEKLGNVLVRQFPHVEESNDGSLAFRQRLNGLMNALRDLVALGDLGQVRRGIPEVFRGLKRHGVHLLPSGFPVAVLEDDLSEPDRKCFRRSQSG